MKKLLALLLTCLMVLMLFTSCSSSTMNEGSNSPGYTDSGYKSESSDYTSGKGNDAEPPAEDANDLTRKIIKTYRTRMETLNYDSAVARIVAEANAFGGYIASSSQDGGGNNSRRSASYTVRIPAAKAEEYLAAISGECNVLSSSLDTEDVTDSYYGYKARLDSLIVQEERLMSMLEKAETLSELLTLEDRLSDVRAEINGIHSKLQLMDKSVDYSFIYLTLYEVKEYVEPEAESYLARVGRSFVEAFKSFATVLGEIFIIFIWLLPYMAVAAVVTLVIILLLRYDKKKRLKKQQSNQEKEENK